jgi:hypothetical protein
MIVYGAKSRGSDVDARFWRTLYAIRPPDYACGGLGREDEIVMVETGWKTSESV